MCATISSHILLYVAIYGYSALHAVAFALAIAIAVAIEVQSKVYCGFAMLEYSLYCSHMAGECTRIVWAESSNCL
jgi:hypothetical protein